MAIVACPKCGAKNRIDERGSELQPKCGRCGANLPTAPPESAGPIDVTDSTFGAQVLEAGATPVLLDCWAPWCGPCRALAPTLKELAAESGGRYVIAKLNTDENPGVASRFQISSIPAMLIFKNGQLVDQLIGLQPKSAIRAAIEKRL